MRTNSRMRGHVLGLAALAVVVSVPELARAQQTGLFPLAPIKRQRPPCDQEDPIYKIYKDKYFGYHPTCWRQFPTGWGCPSPAAPNREESFKKIPVGSAEPRGPLPGEPEEGMEAQPGVARPARPGLPGGAPSPFESDTPATPPTAPRGGQTAPTPPQGDPFDMDRNVPPAPRSGQPPANAPGAASNGPELSAPADQPGAVTGARTSTNDSGSDANATEEVAPLLALPAVTVPSIDDPRVPIGTQPPAANNNVASSADPNANAATASATPRRGLLSGFFSNLGLNWTRR